MSKVTRGLLDLAGLAGLGLVGVVGLTACSLIVQFHDQAACDGGLCLDSGAGVGDDGPSLGDATAEASLPDAGHEGGKGPSEAGVPDVYAPCGSLRSGYYCANDGPFAYAGPPTDLLYCLDGGIGKATPCDGGCLHLPDPFPDACNPCPGVPNGQYCGRDLAGFPAFNADFLIQCQNGDTVQQVACPHGCGSNGAMSACY